MWRAENLPGVVQTLLTPPPRPTAERYRHELKYLISYGEKAALETRIYFNGQNIWWLGLCVALLAAKDVPLRRCMKALLACGLPTLALVELLHFAGVIAPDAASERDGSFRLMFGYGHPNTFSRLLWTI